MSQLHIRPNDLNNPAFVLANEDLINENLMGSPENPDGYVVKACLELYKGDSNAALYYMHFALGLEPHRAGYYTTLAAIYGSIGMHYEAGEALKTGYSYSKSVPSLNWNLSLWLLQNGEFDKGWDLYRWRKVHLPGHRRHIQAEWDYTKRDIEGKTLLVWSEQGLGDQVMMFRFLERIKDRFPFKEVMFECRPDLYNLVFHNLRNIDKIYVQYPDFHTPHHFDEHISLLDLCHSLDIFEEDECRAEPYIKPNPALAQQWNKGLSQLNGPKIGLCWQGSKGHVNDKNRSCPFENFLPLKDIKEWNYISLQKEITDDPVEGFDILHAPDGLINADYTAALISELDCVITVDSFIAHLAGAMGKKTYLMLPYVQEWRWGNGIPKPVNTYFGDTYWYNNVRLYKQRTEGDWATVIGDIIADIKAGV